MAISIPLSRKERVTTVIKNTFLAYILLSLIGLMIYSFDSAYAQSNWVTFRNTEFKFRFIYPPGWKIDTPRGKNVRGKVSSPKGELFASCNIVVKPSPAISKYTQKELGEMLETEVWSANDWLGTLKDKFPDAMINERKRIKIDNLPAQFAVFKYTYETMDMKLYSQSMVFATFTPGYAWLFTCGSAAKDERDAEKNYAFWKPIFTRLFSSFVFEK